MFNGKRLAIVAVSFLLVSTDTKASVGTFLASSSPYLASGVVSLLKIIGGKQLVTIVSATPLTAISVGLLTPMATLASIGLLTYKTCINSCKKGFAVYQKETLLNAGKYYLAAGTNINTIVAFARATKEIFVEGAREMRSTYWSEITPAVREAYNYLKNWTGTIRWSDFSGKALQAVQTFFRKGVENMTPTEVLAAKVALTGGGTLAANVAGEVAAEIGGELLKDVASSAKNSVTGKDVAFGALATIALNGASAVWSTAVNALATIAPFI